MTRREQAQAIVDRWIDPYGTEKSWSIELVAAIEAALDACVEECCKDTKRLDWLEQTKSGLYHYMSGFGPAWEITSNPSNERTMHDTIREAIDYEVKRRATKGRP